MKHEDEVVKMVDSQMVKVVVSNKVEVIFGVELIREMEENYELESQRGDNNCNQIVAMNLVNVSLEIN